MQDRIDFLKATDLFQDVPDGLLRRICRQMEAREVAPGAALFHEGEAGDAVYLVMEGTVSIERDGISVISLGRGACVGEFALIDEGPRSATAVATNEVHLLRWGRQEFQETLRQSPDVATGILKILTGKLRQNTKLQVKAGLERERWRQDLKRAHEIQMGMLPQEDLRTEDVEVSGYCRPADRVGGDFYDYLCFEDGRVGVIISDATGHGFYAGLLVAMAKSCLHTQAKVDYAPDRVMEAMNRTVSMSFESGMLMTSCYVLIDPRQGRLTYTNAGHNYPYHYRRQAGDLAPLKSTDLLLGVPGFEGAGFHTQAHPWGEGDLLLLYSDGITEAEDKQGEMFEEARLQEALLAHRDRPAAEVKEAVLDALARHCEGTEQGDDVTLVVVRGM